LLPPHPSVPRRDRRADPAQHVVQRERAGGLHARAGAGLLRADAHGRARAGRHRHLSRSGAGRLGCIRRPSRLRARGPKAVTRCNFLSRWTYNLDAGDRAERDDGGKFLLVLTCTIDPSTGWAPPPRSSPAARLTDYVWSLGLWLRLKDPRLDDVLLIENSASSLAEL